MTLTLILASHNEGKLAEIRKILDRALPDDRERVKLLSAGSLGLPDPVETGVSFEDNALIKARDVARRTSLPAIADDSGLIVDFLGCAPGVLSARWSGVHGDDEANNRLLLAQLADIPDDQRRARFRCAAALVVPTQWIHGTDQRAEVSFGEDGRIEVDEAHAADHIDGGDRVDHVGATAADTAASFFEFVEIGEMTGALVRAPRGDDGFGYDPIFVPDDQPERACQAEHPLTSAELTTDEKNAISHRGRALNALMPHIARLLGSTTEGDTAKGAVTG